jgi:hypothetical protein
MCTGTVAPCLDSVPLNPLLKLPYDGFRSPPVISTLAVSRSYLTAILPIRLQDLAKQYRRHRPGRKNRPWRGKLCVWTSSEDRSSVTCSFIVRSPCFYAFDLPMGDGKDFRSQSLTHRKQELRRLLSGSFGSYVADLDAAKGCVTVAPRTSVKIAERTIKERKHYTAEV